MIENRFYFRLHDGAANIFRLPEEGQRSHELYNHIGNLVLQNRKITLNQGESLTEEEEAEIRAWMDEQMKIERKRAFQRAKDVISEINNVTHWIQAKSNDREITEIFSNLVLSLHDMRTTAVKRYAKALEKQDGDDDE